MKMWEKAKSFYAEPFVPFFTKFTLITAAVCIALVIAGQMFPEKHAAAKTVEARASTTDMSKSCENYTSGILEFSQVLLVCETVAARGFVHKGNKVAVVAKFEKNKDVAVEINIIRDYKVLPFTSARNKSPIKALAEALAKAH